MRSYNRFDTPLTRAAVARLTAPEVRPMNGRLRCACGTVCLQPESVRTGICSLCRMLAGKDKPSPTVGEKSGGHPEYLKLLDEMRELHVRKGADYGTTADPFANIRAASEIDIDPVKGCWLRCKDKVKRLDQFFRTGALANESAEDSFVDLASYCLIAVAMMREGKAGK